MGAHSSLQVEDSIGGGSLAISPAQPSKSWSAPRPLYPGESVALSVTVEPTGTANQKRFKLQGTPIPAYLGGATLWTRTGGEGNSFLFKAVNTGGLPQAQTVTVSARWIEVDNQAAVQEIVGNGGTGAARKLDIIDGSASGSAVSERATFTWEFTPRLQFVGDQFAITFSAGAAASGANIKLEKYTFATEPAWNVQSSISSPSNQVTGSISSTSPGKGVLKALYNNIAQGRSDDEIAFAELDLGVASFGSASDLAEDRLSNASTPHEMNPGSLVIAPTTGNNGTGSRSKLTLKGDGGTPKEGTYTLTADNLENLEIYETPVGGNPIPLPPPWSAASFSGSVTLYVGAKPFASDAEAQACTFKLTYKRTLASGSTEFELADSVKVRLLPSGLDLAISKFGSDADLAEDRTPSGEPASPPHEMSPGSLVIAPIVGSNDGSTRTKLTLKGNGQILGEGTFTLTTENLANLEIYETPIGGNPIPLPPPWSAASFPGSVTLYVGAKPFASGAEAQDGIIKLTYKRPTGSGSPDFEMADSVRLRLLPAQIEVRKQETTKPPDDGLLVKKGDVLEFALAPQFFDKDDNFETLISWQQQQLKSDGTYTKWSNISEQATGTKFKHTTTVGGIFQIKAIITNGEEHGYKRNKDAPHGANKDGVYNESLKKGKYDCVGVVDAQWQIDVRNKASGKLSQTTWAQSKVITGSQIGFGVDVSYVAGAGSDKCNIFVFMQANAAGATVPTRVWRDILFGIPPWVNRNIAPTADQWDDKEATETTWNWLPTTTLPQPGFVVSRTSLAGTTHVGIVDYDGTWINAGPVTINKYIDFTMPLYQPVHFRKK